MRTTGKKVLLTLGISLTAVIGIYCGISVFFFSHFFPDTVLNGVNASFKTAKGIEESIQDEIGHYTLELVERGDKKEVIHSNEITLVPLFGTEIQEKINQQNGFAWFFHLFHKDVYELETVLSYNKSQLKTAIKQLKCMDASRVIEPENASISDYKNGYEIIPEVLGTKVKEAVLVQVLDDAIMNLKDRVSLEKENCYVAPKYTSETKRIQNAVKKMNEYTGAEITYDFGNNQEVADGAVISGFLDVDSKFKVHLNRERMLTYVQSLSSKYNTIFRDKTFRTSYDKTITITNGDYGWWMNQGAELEALEANIKKGEKVTREAEYLQTAASHDGNDYGTTYVEINITAQHLFFYKKGRLILESDFVSGNPSLNNGTPSGAYSITYKEQEATLRGENYETPVQYWMPFNGNIGMHDASWRTEFGGDLYQSAGSHGCINLPPPIAKKLFSVISKGDPVIVYQQKGTESKPKK
ncbi:MAG: peptidoglycan binding domain-containing protein [Lachnospiraceae bacterium]